LGGAAVIRLRLGPLQLAALQCHTDVCEDETDCPATLAADGSALEFAPDRAADVWSWLTEAVNSADDQYQREREPLDRAMRAALDRLWYAAAKAARRQRELGVVQAADVAP
jgi:hypothetical protein